MKINVALRLQQTKPDITEADLVAIKNWIKTNIMDKLPADASATWSLCLES